MLARLKRGYADLVTSGAQLMLLLVGFQLASRNGWQFVLALMALISLFAWYSALYRLRTIGGTPTSRIASAAQGYVELLGQGRCHPDAPLLSRLRQLPCLWYRYRIEEKNDRNQWRLIDSGESENSFLLDDGSGQCIVDPSGAEILTRHRDSWRQGRRRYTEWQLIPGDRLYALGHFKTVGGGNDTTTAQQLVKATLAEWKADRTTLLQRFDLDGNGELDMQEWMLARQAAKREAQKRLTELRNQADLHFLLCPPDGKLFLLSNLEPERLRRRYLFWAWAHLGILFGALGGLVWIGQ